MLAVNKTLTSVGYATLRSPTHLRCARQQPLSVLAFCPLRSLRPLTLMRRLDGNELRSEGAKHVADMLAVNQTLTSVEYAMPRSPTHALHEHERSSHCQC